MFSLPGLILEVDFIRNNFFLILRYQNSCCASNSTNCVNNGFNLTTIIICIIVIYDNAYSIYKETVYKLIGAGVLVDALNLAEYFDQAKVGRKPSK